MFFDFRDNDQSMKLLVSDYMFSPRLGGVGEANGRQSLPQILSFAVADASENELTGLRASR